MAAPARGAPLGLGWGALLALALCLAARPAPALVASHVRPHTTLGTAPAVPVALHRPAMPLRPRAVVRAAPAAAGAAAAAGRGVAASAGLSVWLSVAAVTISLVTAVLNCTRPFEAPAPAPAKAKAPVEDLYRALQDYDDDYQTPVSNRMDEVVKNSQAEQARRKLMTPQQVVIQLQRGNARFWSNMSERPELSVLERRALILAQAPYVCVVSCADSRVPVEIVFDQGLGTMFVVRVAGNILDQTAIGSVEFSVKYLGVKVLLVMGHEACGAVQGAMTMTQEKLDKQPKYLQSVLRSIKDNLDIPRLNRIQDYRAQDREAVVCNTMKQVLVLSDNPLIAEKARSGDLLVCGAFYEISSGIVDFFTLASNGLVSSV